MLEILKASKGLPVTDPLAALWGQKIAEGGAWQLTTITGTLPLTVLANGKTLTDYKIYGETVQDGTPTPDNPAEVTGLGVRAENLFYKLPLTITSHGAMTEHPVYIGNSQLMRIPDTDYADYVDYEKGKIVRRVKKLVLTGEENFEYQKYTYSRTFVLDIPDISLKTFRVVSNAFAGSNSLPLEDYRKDKIFVTLHQWYKHPAIGIGANRWSGNVDAFKTYLADQYATGTPVTVWYALETPIEEDPPVPFPEIALPKGEATIDIEGELKPQAAIIGEIKEI